MKKCFLFNRFELQKVRTFLIEVKIILKVILAKINRLFKSQRFNFLDVLIKFITIRKLKLNKSVTYFLSV